MTTTPTRSVALRVGVLLLAATSLFACSKSDDASSNDTTAPTTESTSGDDASTTAAPSGDAPSFTSFEVDGPVPCESGNATATMAYETENVETIAISIDGGEFASTAGYGPDETDVVASIPCTGAGEATIQLQGCNAADQCTDSDEATVEITAG